MVNFELIRSSLVPEDFLCTSTTIESLSYTPSEKEKFRDDGHLVDTGRRSWKTLKGKGEAVWPPPLEAALLEALEKYQPSSIGLKISRNVGRFPMRNRFISDYIYELTGKIRTPKQVGSRLQQLRETCKGDKLRKLLGHQPDHRSPTSDGFDPCVRLPVHSVEANELNHLQYRAEPITVHVRIHLQEQPSYLPPTIQLIGNSSASPQVIQPSSRCSITQSKPLIPFSPISVQFASQYALALQSSFTVYTKASSFSLHIEHGQLKCLSSPVHGGGWCYGGEIVPDFWERLRISTDISKYIIVQSIRPTKPCEDSPVSMNSPVTIIYTFTLPPLPSPQSYYPLCRLMDASASSSLNSTKYLAHPPHPATETYYSDSSPSDSSPNSTPWTTPQSSGGSMPLPDDQRCSFSQASQALIWDQSPGVRQVTYPTSHSATHTKSLFPQSDAKLWPFNSTYLKAPQHLPHPSFYGT